METMVMEAMGTITRKNTDQMVQNNQQNCPWSSQVISDNLFKSALLISL